MAIRVRRRYNGTVKLPDRENPNVVQESRLYPFCREGGRILESPIEMARHPYNSAALPCSLLFRFVKNINLN